MSMVLNAALWTYHTLDLLPHTSTSTCAASIDLSTVIVTLPHLNPIAGLFINDGDIAPLQLLDDFHHGAHLVVVRGYGAREVLEAGLVRQLR